MVRSEGRIPMYPSLAASCAWLPTIGVTVVSESPLSRVWPIRYPSEPSMMIWPVERSGWMMTAK